MLVDLKTIAEILIDRSLIEQENRLIWSLFHWTSGHGNMTEQGLITNK